MRLAILTGMYLLAITPADAGAAWKTPGTEMWGACARALLPMTTTDMAYNAGLCGGVVNAVAFTKDDICLPEQVTRYQATRVVVRYFETHPEQLHLDGVALVATALREAWPCK
jgi:hypothetical protein